MPVTRSPSRPPSGSPAYSPTDLPAYRGGSSFSPLDLSPLAWARSSISTLYQDSAGATPVTGAGQDVGLREDQSGNGNDWTRVTPATARPTYETGPARLEYDGVDDSLDVTLPAISGGQIVIISPAGTWIDDFSFAGGTFTVGPDTYTGGPAGLMSLLGNEEIEIIILPTPMTAGEQAKMVSYAQGLGSAGLIQVNANEATITSWLSPRIADMTTENFVLQDIGTVTAGKTYLIGYDVSGYNGPGGTSTVGAASSSRTLFSPELPIGEFVQSNNFSALRVEGCATSGTFQIYTRGPANAAGANEALFENITIREVIMP